jgi:hypothetical protein
MMFNTIKLINQLVFVMEMHYVFCEVETEFLNIVQMQLGLYSLLFITSWRCKSWGILSIIWTQLLENF